VNASAAVKAHVQLCVTSDGNYVHPPGKQADTGISLIKHVIKITLFI
jgi:hypothetical protein